MEPFFLGHRLAQPDSNQTFTKVMNVDQLYGMGSGMRFERVIAGR